MDGNLTDVHITRHGKDTHLIFVNVVLLFGILSIMEWKHIYGIINLFGTIFVLLMNTTKYHMICVSPEDVLAMDISQLFGVTCTTLDAGFKYLGFMPKPNYYGIKDWR